MNSLINKVLYVKHLAARHHLSVVAICETWLVPSVSSSFVAVDGFQVVRGDGSDSIRKHGCCLYVADSLSFVPVEVDLLNVAVVFLTDLCVYVVAVYRPPSYTAVQDESLLLFLSEFCIAREVLLLGDFNLPSLNWGLENVLQGYIPPRELLFFDTFCSLGLNQWVKEGTFVDSNNILDLILSTEADRVGEVRVLEPFPRCHHCPVVCEYILQFNITENFLNSSERILWSKGNYMRMSDNILAVDWDYEFDSKSLDECYTYFVHFMKELIDRFVPTGAHASSPTWMKGPPRWLEREKGSKWKEYKRQRKVLGRNHDQTLDALNSFNVVNYQYRNYVRERQCYYESSIVGRLASAPKLFHSYIRRRKIGCPSVGPLRSGNGEIVSTASEMCEMLVTSFSAVFVAETPRSIHDHQEFDGSFDDISLSPVAVVEALSRLDGSSAAGPDGLHSCMLKRCSVALSWPLYFLFVKFLEEGVLPRLWKTSVVVFLFKSGSRCNPLNYRPVRLNVRHRVNNFLKFSDKSGNLDTKSRLDINHARLLKLCKIT